MKNLIQLSSVLNVYFIIHHDILKKIKTYFYKSILEDIRYKRLGEIPREEIN